MEPTNVASYFDFIQWLVGGGFVASLAGYLWNKYFRIRPKIVATLVWGGSSQSSDGPERLKFEWWPKIVLHNDSIYKARRLKIIDSNSISNWKINSKLPDVVEPDSKVEWSFTIGKSELRTTLVELCGEETLREHRMAEAYLPIVIGRAELIFSYDNEKDRTFYTVIKINEKVSQSTLHWFKPKPSKN